MQIAASRFRVAGFLMVAAVGAASVGACGSTGNPGSPATAATTGSAPSKPAEADRVSVPNVAKLPYPEARKKLEEAGFKVVVPVDINDTAVIASTSPSAGAFIPKGSSIELRVDQTAKKPTAASAKSPAKKSSR